MAALAGQIAERWKAGHSEDAVELQRSVASMLPGNAKFHATFGLALFEKHGLLPLLSSRSQVRHSLPPIDS